MQLFTFGFAQDEAEGSVELLGGKGAGLVWLSNRSVPVPPGFVIPTSAWTAYEAKPKATMKAIAKVLPVYLKKLEQHFGYMPLLSVRSGARVSCPGMMDTILNVGIDAENMPGWINRLGPKCFNDSFLRLVTMYGKVVMGLWKESAPDNLKVALDEYKALTGLEFPDAKAQILGAIEAVFKSWDNERAVTYRRREGYDRAWGTAVTIQAMVFGNLNEQSGTGVLFTRNPNTGGMGVTGEFLVNAQGEDIVDGSRTPLPLDEMKAWNSAVHDQLLEQVIKLENLKKEMLDIEFTVQDGTLYLLQVRTGKRSAMAALKIAVDMSKQGLLDAASAVKSVSLSQFDKAQQSAIDSSFTKGSAFQGIPACNGVVTGKPVFSSADALKCKEPCILVTEETTPEDIAGMYAAVGIVTMTGGMTCHAAVNARSINRACVVGVGAPLESFKDIEVLSLDGETGRIWTEAVPMIQPESNGTLREFTQLVCSALGTVPVIFAPPTHEMPEALLYLGDQILNTDTAVKTVMKTLTYVGQLYLDLVPSEEEARFLKLVEGSKPVDRLLKALATEWGSLGGDFYDRLKVIVPADCQTVFQRVPYEHDLRALVLSFDKEIVVNGLNTSDPAIQRVLKWKVQEGVAVVSIGTYVAGAKSMISVPAAMQIIGNGG